MAEILSAAQIQKFKNDGFLKIPNFYDLDRKIVPIQKDIYEIILIISLKNGIIKMDEIPPFSPKNFDILFNLLVNFDRRLGATVYDAVKHIPSLLRLVSDEKNEAISKQLTQSDLTGAETGGYGIRIDIPGEETYSTPWHQDFASHFRSLEGIVLWTPLVCLEKGLGPVKICKGSNNVGPLPLNSIDKNSKLNRGGVGYHIHNIVEILNNFKIVSPLSSPGDLLILDWMTIHKSGKNQSNKARWSVQIRYFNFRNEWGINNEWVGAFSAGNKPEDIIPDLVVQDR